MKVIIESGQKEIKELDESLKQSRANKKERVKNED